MTHSSTDVAQGSVYQLPKGFTFSKLEGWASWIKRFESCRIASNLDLKDHERQVYSPLYALGDEAEDILESFRLSDDKRKSYETVRVSLNHFFLQRKETVFD